MLTRPEHLKLLRKIQSERIELHRIIGGKALFGLKTGFNDAFIIDISVKEKLIHDDENCKNVIKPILFGRDVKRYQVNYKGRNVIYLHPELDVSEFEPIHEHLHNYKDSLSKRAGSQNWYELQQPAVALIPQIKQPKIVYPIISNECRFALDTNSYFINDKMFVLPTSDLSILAILNSKLANFYFSIVCAALEGQGDRYLEFRAQYVDPFPIPGEILSENISQNLSYLSEQMIFLINKHSNAKTSHELTTLKRQIELVDIKINNCVFNLYGLTKEEIRIIENSTEN